MPASPPGRAIRSPGRRGPWRAWNTFLLSLGIAFLAFLGFLGASLVLHLRHGDLSDGQAGALLRLLYWGTYPLVFVALGALGWHLVQSERGAYARR
ncbi:MAG: hypothetical protein AABY18_04615 [Candidatus Thermoplasmatota archaeon]